MSDLTILVNTSDNFEDCWKPFFTLFQAYWPDCPYPIVLNTEHKDFSWPGLNVRAAKAATGSSRRLTWSECLANCLEGIDTPYVLYLQEDYFLEGTVKAEPIERLLGHMRNGEADVIRILECGGSGPWHPTQNEDLWAIDRQSKYLINMQAALWRKSVLRTSLRMHESPWQLEILGTRRARRRKEKICCVNRDLYSGRGKEIIPYTATGVVAGRWARDIVVPLFDRHGIEVDYAKRGFYDPKVIRKKAPIWRRALDHLRSAV